MSARTRSALIITGILVTILPILFFISARVIQQGFNELETTDTRTHVNQAVKALEADLNELYSKTRAWSASDDGYNFLAGTNPGYLESRFFPTTMLNLRVHVVAYISDDNEIVSYREFSPENGLSVPAAVNPSELLRANPDLIPKPRQSRRGIVFIGSRPMLVAVSPVTPGNPMALSNGYLLFGRYLNETEIQLIADTINLLLEVRPVDASDLPADFVAARETLSHESISTSPLDDKTVAGYTLLTDLKGEPRLILRVQLLRDIFARGQNTLRLFFLALLLLGVAFGWAGQVTLEKMMVSQQASMETSGRYRAVVEQISEGMIQIDAESKIILEVNPSFASLLGYDPVSLLGKSLYEINLQDRAELDRDLQLMTSTTQRLFGERRYRGKDGGWIDVEVSATRIAYNGRNVLCVVIRDITERKQAETALKVSEERYQLATEGANDGLWDWNLPTGELYLSHRWKTMLGYNEDEVHNTPEGWFDLVHPDDLRELRAQIDAHLLGNTNNFQSEHRMRHRDGSYRWMLSRGLAVFNQDGKPYRMAGSLTDITERKQTEDQFRHDALHDTLTGLPNRALFLDRLGQAIERSKRRPDYLFALLFLDFDRFKVINDSLGHTTGDQLLVAGAHRLETCLRAMDTIARLGGDEFVILVEYIDSPHDAIRVAERIQDALQPCFELNGHEIFISASIGIVLSSIGYDHAEDALRDADIAMYRSKALGRARYELFKPDLRSVAMARLEMETDLRRAIERNEFIVHYQPILSLSTGQISGFEALIRWQHPGMGMISPGEFIPVAEETGLIIPIGQWVLREACRQMKEWQSLYPAYRDLTISVNMSGKQFSQPDLPDMIRCILEETGLDIRCLRLEITESVVMEAVETTMNMLKQLKTLGVQLEIDDFGTGYSSLSYLQQLPIDAIKIDRSFISQMVNDGNNHGIVQAIIALAHNLGMHVIAEGVEAAEQLDRLKAMQCELGQGYLFHRPMNETEVTGLLTQSNTPG